MTLLVVGLLLFLILHLIPSAASLRAALVEGLGEKPYRGVFAAIAFASDVGGAEGLRRQVDEAFTEVGCANVAHASHGQGAHVVDAGDGVPGRRLVEIVHYQPRALGRELARDRLAEPATRATFPSRVPIFLKHS